MFSSQFWRLIIHDQAGPFASGKGPVSCLCSFMEEGRWRDPMARQEANEQGGVLLFPLYQHTVWETNWSSTRTSFISSEGLAPSDITTAN
jgi:hypothetical protein